MSQTLYDKYGGFSAISRIVHDFYEGVRASPTLKPYFEGSTSNGWRSTRRTS